MLILFPLRTFNTCYCYHIICLLNPFILLKVLKDTCPIHDFGVLYGTCLVQHFYYHSYIFYVKKIYEKVIFEVYIKTISNHSVHMTFLYWKISSNVFVQVWKMVPCDISAVFETVTFLERKIKLFYPLIFLWFKNMGLSSRGV